MEKQFSIRTDVQQTVKFRKWSSLADLCRVDLASDHWAERNLWLRQSRPITTFTIAICWKKFVQSTSWATSKKVCAHNTFFRWGPSFFGIISAVPLRILDPRFLTVDILARKIYETFELWNWFHEISWTTHISYVIGRLTFRRRLHAFTKKTIRDTLKLHASKETC